MCSAAVNLDTDHINYWCVGSSFSKTPERACVTVLEERKLQVGGCSIKLMFLKREHWRNLCPRTAAAWAKPLRAWSSGQTPLWWAAAWRGCSWWSGPWWTARRGARPSCTAGSGRSYPSEYPRASRGSTTPGEPHTIIANQYLLPFTSFQAVSLEALTNFEMSLKLPISVCI